MAAVHCQECSLEIVVCGRCMPACICVWGEDGTVMIGRLPSLGACPVALHCAEPKPLLVWGAAVTPCAVPHHRIRTGVLRVTCA